MGHQFFFVRWLFLFRCYPSLNLFTAGISSSWDWVVIIPVSWGWRWALPFWRWEASMHLGSSAIWGALSLTRSNMTLVFPQIGLEDSSLASMCSQKPIPSCVSRRSLCLFIHPFKHSRYHSCRDVTQKRMALPSSLNSISISSRLGFISSPRVQYSNLLFQVPRGGFPLPRWYHKFLCLSVSSQALLVGPWRWSEDSLMSSTRDRLWEGGKSTSIFDNSFWPALYLRLLFKCINVGISVHWEPGQVASSQSQ